MNGFSPRSLACACVEGRGSAIGLISVSYYTFDAYAYAYVFGWESRMVGEGWYWYRHEDVVEKGPMSMNIHTYIRSVPT